MIDITQEEIMRNWGVDNSDNPLVSVKCMTFNHEKYISQAMDGFLMQKTTFPFEILVHDDASTDKTTDILREYEKQFPKIVKVIYEEENQWSKGYRLHHVKINKSIKGKYIATCEGDDYWIDDNKLQKQVLFLEQNSDYGLVYTKTGEYVQKSESFLKPVGKQTDFIGLLMCENPIATLTACFRKELYNKYLIDIKPEERNWKMGDYPFWIYLAYNSKIKYIDDLTGIYRILEKSACHYKNIDEQLLFIKGKYDMSEFYQKLYNVNINVYWDESMFYIPIHFSKGHRKQILEYKEKIFKEK